jgi:hypothetical protein
MFRRFLPLNTPRFYIRPDADDSAGNWTSTAASLYEAIDEASPSDADYIEVLPESVTLSLASIYTGKGQLSGTPAGFTSGSVSYGANKLLVAVVGTSDGNPNSTAGSTLSGGGLTWTKRLSRDSTDATYNCVVEVWTAETTSSGSGALTWARASGGPNGTNCGWVLSVAEVSGHDSAWLGTSKIENAATTGAHTMTLPATPDTGSLVIAGRFAETEGAVTLATPGSGWTELHDDPPGRDGWTCLQTQYRLDPASASVVWDDVDSANDGRTAITTVFGLEIKPAEAVGNITKLRLSNPSVTPAEPMTVKYRAQKTVDAGTMELRVRLLQGTTQIASWTESNVPVAVTEYSHTLSSGEFAAITDFNDLFLELRANYT